MRRNILLSFWFCEAPIIMSNPWERPPLPIRGDDDQDTTHAAVGSVLTNWENIEGELSHIFALYIGKMWTNEAYDQYYEKGRTTKGRLQNLETAANAYFVKSPNQEAEGAFCKLLEYLVLQIVAMKRRMESCGLYSGMVPCFQNLLVRHPTAALSSAWCHHIISAPGSRMANRNTSIRQKN